MKEFEIIRKKIDTRTPESSKKESLIQQIENTEAELLQAKESKDRATAENDLTEFQRCQASEAMLSARLEKLQQELKSIVEYPPITAEEHLEIKREILQITKNIIMSKYKELDSLLGEGAKIIAEIEDNIKQYYSELDYLDNLVHEWDEDAEGNTFRKFCSSDIYQVRPEIKKVFCDLTSIGSIRGTLANKINTYSI